MTPGTLDLALYRGDSYGLMARVWEDDAHTEPADLTGVTAAAQVHIGGVVVPMTCVVTANAVEVTLAATSWNGARHGRGSWDLQLTYPDGRIQTLLAGAVVVSGDVTP